MTQEQKELLLKELSSRLPYNVKCQFEDTIEIVKSLWFCEDEGWQVDGEKTSTCIHAVKPYLFPLSSMTEEQEEEFKTLYYRFHESAFIFNERFAYDRYRIKVIGFYPCYLQDWLNQNHFDYRGLIEKGLALDATNKNIY